MDERHDLGSERTCAPSLPLWRAVIVAHERIFPEVPDLDDRVLDVLALALTELMAIYTRDSVGEEPRRVTDEEICVGRFTATATRLEFANGRSPIANLTVSKLELDRALTMLKVESIERARVSLTLRQSPRVGRNSRAP